MKIFLNLYREARNILHIVIPKKPLPPIVYATTRLEDGTCWKNHITLCKAIKTLATNSVWQTNKFHKTVIINAEISLTVSGIKAESESIWKQYFFGTINIVVAEHKKVL